MAAKKPDLAPLRGALEASIGGLSKVTWRKMFGCDAAFAGDAIFGLIWKEGRIGVKLTDGEDYEALMALDGAGPWKAGPMKMSHWVLVPESMHGKKTVLAKWVAKAHTQALKPRPDPSLPRAASRYGARAGGAGPGPRPADRKS